MAAPARFLGGSPVSVRQTGQVTDAMVRTRLWRNGVVECVDFPFAEISDYVCQGDSLVWVGLRAPTPDKLRELADELSLAPLAVEDASDTHERPKASRYETHTFFTAYGLDLPTRSPGEPAQLQTAQVSAFVLPHAVVTVFYEDWFSMDPVIKRWDENLDLIKHGPKAITYVLLDYLVDTHFDVIQGLDDGIESLEDTLFDDGSSTRTMQRQTFALRKALVQARRVILPMREVLITFNRRDAVLADELRSYFEDLYDHVLRASEWTESLRDMISSIYETNLSLADSRLNMIMKKLTAWAAIIAIPTAVTGFYGQNVPYPGFGKTSGLLTSVSIMVVLIALLYILFKRKDWL
jgi:magnesium transporter